MGEVLAFAKFGEDTMKKGEKAMTDAFGEPFVKEFFENNQNHIDVLYEIANAADMQTVMCDKSAKTFEKFEKMRDVYLHDEWDDAVEIMEWLGFFEGAAIVHWSLVSGLSKKQENEKLHALCVKAQKMHEELFETITETITTS